MHHEIKKIDIFKQLKIKKKMKKVIENKKNQNPEFLVSFVRRGNYWVLESVTQYGIYNCYDRTDDFKRLIPCNPRYKKDALKIISNLRHVFGYTKYEVAFTSYEK